MRLAYADPPYPGKAWRYPENQEVDHAKLLKRLESYDGWALSTNATTLHMVLDLCPADIRIAVWVKPFAAFKRNVRVAYTWEPVIFREAPRRPGAAVTRDHLSRVITLRRGVVGAKPEPFCRWVLDLMGYINGDEVYDLYPGTGAMGRVLAQASLALTMADQRE